MRYKNVPDGWGFDGEDPSVGIFGDTWFHEDCLVVQGPGSKETEGASLVEDKVSDPDERGVAVVTYLLVCHDCAETALFKHEEFVGVDEAA